jgi:hypothetical protein
MREWTAEDVETTLRGFSFKNARLLESGDIEVEYKHLAPYLDIRSKLVFKKGSEAFDALINYTGELEPGKLLDLQQICWDVRRANDWKDYDTQTLQDGFDMKWFKEFERLENENVRLYRANRPGSFIEFPSTSEQCKFLLEKLGPINPGCKIDLLSSLDND